MIAFLRRKKLTPPLPPAPAHGGRVEVPRHVFDNYRDVVDKAFQGCRIIEINTTSLDDAVIYYADSPGKFERLPDDCDFYHYEFLFRTLASDETGSLTPYFGFRRIW